MQIKSCITLFAFVAGISAFQCPQKISKQILSKIEFDYTTIDQDGLDRGDVAVEYEFCIPQDDNHFKEVLVIEENTKVMKSSKGRIGCMDQQWLCMVSTHHPQWQERLYAIASLSYVDKIIRTYYE